MLRRPTTVCITTPDLDGHLVPDVQVAGVVVDVDMRPRSGELERRRREGPHCELSWQELQALARVPSDGEVRWDALDLETSMRVDCLPPGCVVASSISVRRVWSPAADIIRISVTTADWQDGLEAVSTFAAAGPRLLRLTRIPRDRGQLVRAAERVGVAVVGADGRQIVAGPPAARSAAASPTRWELAEAAYAAWASRPAGASTS